MNNIEKVKEVRRRTLSPINKVNAALQRTNWDVDAAVELLVKEKQVDTNDMANRTADACIVHSYIHNNRIGAMIVLACQTDFVAKNAVFLSLARNICMHIVSTPVAPEYVAVEDVPAAKKEMIWNSCVLLSNGFDKKPPQIQRKIIDGKLARYYEDACLLNQKFVKDETKTVDQIINDASSTLGEKIEVKQFVKMVAQ